MESFIVLIFQLAILLMSVVIHEFAHGWMAFRLGDSTAKYYGRLTLNPIKHLDFWGSFLVPLMIYLFSGGQAILGWAKPVPFNPYNLRDQKYGIAKVALAGPLANLSVALVFGLSLRLTGDSILAFSGLAQIFSLIVILNILLAIFNLIPLPPLDGSKILFTFLPRSFENIRIFLEQYGMIILLLIVFFAFSWILPLVFWLFRLIVGS
ncbi:MAG: site-2 protease family protein [Patescibacteria group bacterium]